MRTSDREQNIQTKARPIKKCLVIFLSNLATHATRNIEDCCRSHVFPKKVFKGSGSGVFLSDMLVFKDWTWIPALKHLIKAGQSVKERSGTCERVFRRRWWTLTRRCCNDSSIRLGTKNSKSSKPLSVRNKTARNSQQALLHVVSIISTPSPSHPRISTPQLG